MEWLTGAGNTSYSGYGNRGYGGRGGSFRPFLPKPVEVGKEYQVDITEVSKRGDGIAKVEGFVVFVAGAKSGQKGVRIKITSVANRFATAELVSAQTAEATQEVSAETPSEKSSEVAAEVTKESASEPTSE